MANSQGLYGTGYRVHLSRDRSGVSKARKTNRDAAKEKNMLDIVYVLVAILFFALAAAYIRGCAKL